MKIAKIEIHNTDFFGACETFELLTTDGYRRIQTDAEHSLRAFHALNKPSVYSQVVMGVVGLNASGKTMLIQLLSALLRIIGNNVSLQESPMEDLLHKLMYREQGDFHWVVYMMDTTYMYRWTARIGQKNGKYYYIDEEIARKKVTQIKSRKNLYEFDEKTKITRRADYLENPFLRENTSIIETLKLKVIVHDNIFINNMNLPLWRGEAPVPLLNSLDSSIASIKIDVDKDEGYKAQVQFKADQEKCEYALHQQLMQVLSSGTIKALSLFGAVIETLKNGGYLIMDEIENHWNRKIVEWIFELFQNKEANPHGACLIFTTHYPELLDVFVRKDNIYIVRRRKDYTAQLVCYSDQIKRNELSKSNVILCNLIDGTAPKYQVLKGASDYIIAAVKAVPADE